MALSALVPLPKGYTELLEQIAGRIARSQTRPALAVSRELVLLYWSMGAGIVLRQKTQGWGAKVVDRLGRDLQARFAGVESFGPRNLKYMRSLAEAWARPRNSGTACGIFAAGAFSRASRFQPSRTAAPRYVLALPRIGHMPKEAIAICPECQKNVVPALELRAPGKPERIPLLMAFDCLKSIPTLQS